MGFSIFFFLTVYGAISWFIYAALDDIGTTTQERAVAIGIFWLIYFVVWLIKTFVRSANILIDDIFRGNL